MKTKSVLILLLVLVIATVAGCTSYSEPSLYNTEVYGVYRCSVFTGVDEKVYEMNLTLNNDKTYEYKVLDKSEAEENFKEIPACSGRISSISEINDDITKIILDDVKYQLAPKYSECYSNMDDTIYKYKNRLGNYIKADIDTSADFVVALSPNDPHKKIFKKSGVMINENIEGFGSSFKYKIKDNVIYLDYSSDNKYYPAYYIVDGGLFLDTYSKVN